MRDSKHYEAPAFTDIVLDSITDPLCSLDREWRFVYVNTALEKMSGSEGSQLVGRSYWDLFPSALRTPVEQQFERAVREGAPSEFEQYYEPLFRWYCLRCYPTAAGGLSLLFRDITEQKTSGDELKRQWRTFDTVLSHTPDQTYILDSEGRFLYANQALIKFIEKPLEDILGKTFAQLGFPQESIATVAHHLKQTIATGESVRYDATFQHPSGDARHYEYIFAPIRADDGTVEAVCGSSRDVAERKKSEKAFTERARLNALGADVGAALTQIERLPQALQQCAEALVEHLDAAFARVWTLALSEDVLELRASAGLYTHLDGPHARVPVGLFKIGLIAQERRPHLTNDVAHDSRVSDPAWAQRAGMVAFAGYPLVIEDRLVGVLGLFARHPLTDYTLTALASVADTIAIGIERKQAEEVLARQAQELARSNADLQQFAYVTSHDLQEPLRSMISFSQLLSRRYRGRLDSEADEFLGFIVSGALRMKGLVEALLAYSRVVNVETMPFVPVPLESALHWATMNLQTVIDESHTSVTSDELPTVLADQVQLVQLFQNLVHNAIKYRKSDVLPHIHLSAERRGQEWVISVKDNGIGIEPEYIDQVFGVFKRLHGKEIPGTGIGLAISKRIVEKHGGRLWAESEYGRGSTFYFSLPA